MGSYPKVAMVISRYNSTGETPMKKSLLNTLLIIFSGLIIGCGEGGGDSENSTGAPDSTISGNPPSKPRKPTKPKVVTLKGIKGLII